MTSPVGLDHSIQSTILVTNRWNRSHFVLNFLTFLHSLFTPLFSLECAPLLPQCWATHILEYWDDCNPKSTLWRGKSHKCFKILIVTIISIVACTKIPEKPQVCWVDDTQQAEPPFVFFLMWEEKRRLCMNCLKLIKVPQLKLLD